MGLNGINYNELVFKLLKLFYLFCWRSLFVVKMWYNDEFVIVIIIGFCYVVVGIVWFLL